MPLLSRCATLCLVFAMTASAEPRQRVVVRPLLTSDASLATLAATMQDQLLTELSKTPWIDAISPADIAALVGLQREKALLGCDSEAAACMAEMTAALGAPFLLTGSLSRLGKTLRVDVKLIRTADGSSAYREGRNLKDEAELFEAVSSLVQTLAASPALKPRSTGPGPLPWVLVGAGAVTAGVGAYFSAQAASAWSTLHDPQAKSQLSWPQVQAQGRTWSTDVVLGPALAGVGVAAVVGGLVWWRAASGEPPAPVVVLPTGQGLAVGGAF